MDNLEIVKIIDGLFHFRGPHLFPVESKGLGDYTDTPANCVVKNVRLMSNSKFRFELNSGSGEYESTYPWAFVFITVENMVKYKHYQELRKLSDDATKLAENAFDLVHTLANDDGSFKMKFSDITKIGKKLVKPVLSSPQYPLWFNPSDTKYLCGFYNPNIDITTSTHEVICNKTWEYILKCNFEIGAFFIISIDGICTSNVLNGVKFKEDDMLAWDGAVWHHWSAPDGKFEMAIGAFEDMARRENNDDGNISIGDNQS